MIAEYGDNGRLLTATLHAHVIPLQSEPKFICCSLQYFMSAPLAMPLRPQPHQIRSCSAHILIGDMRHHTGRHVVEMVAM